MYAARFDDPIAHTSALAGLIGGAIVEAIVGAALVATVATGGVAAPLLVGAVLTGAAVGAWVDEYLGLKAAKDSMDKYVYLRSNPTREHEIERMGETTLIRDMTEVLTSLRRQTLRQTGGET